MRTNLHLLSSFDMNSSWGGFLSFTFSFISFKQKYRNTVESLDVASQQYSLSLLSVWYQQARNQSVGNSFQRYLLNCPQSLSLNLKYPSLFENLRKAVTLMRMGDLFFVCKEGNSHTLARSSNLQLWYSTLAFSAYLKWYCQKQLLMSHLMPFWFNISFIFWKFLRLVITKHICLYPYQKSSIISRFSSLLLALLFDMAPISHFQHSCYRKEVGFLSKRLDSQSKQSGMYYFIFLLMNLVLALAESVERTLDGLETMHSFWQFPSLCSQEQTRVGSNETTLMRVTYTPSKYLCLAYMQASFSKYSSPVYLSLPRSKDFKSTMGTKETVTYELIFSFGQKAFIQLWILCSYSSLSISLNTQPTGRMDRYSLRQSKRMIPPPELSIAQIWFFIAASLSFDLRTEGKMISLKRATDSSQMFSLQQKNLLQPRHLLLTSRSSSMFQQKSCWGEGVYSF